MPVTGSLSKCHSPVHPDLYLPSISHSLVATSGAFSLHARPVLGGQSDAREGKPCPCPLGGYRESRRPDVYYSAAWRQIKDITECAPNRYYTDLSQYPWEKGALMPTVQKLRLRQVVTCLRPQLVRSRVKNGVQISRFKIPVSFFNIPYLCLSQPVSLIIF